MPCFCSSVFRSFQNSDRARHRLKSEKEVRSLFVESRGRAQEAMVAYNIDLSLMEVSTRKTAQ